MKLAIALVEEIGFHLAQECSWYNPAKMPMPPESVTVRRVRIKDYVEYVWWFSKTARTRQQVVVKILTSYGGKVFGSKDFGCLKNRFIFGSHGGTRLVQRRGCCASF